MAEDRTSKPDSSEDTRRYWDHLDAKFATFGVPPAPTRDPAPEPAPEPDPIAAPDLVPAPVGERQPASRLIAEAFSALLALEDGQPGARPVRLTFTEEREGKGEEKNVPPAPVAPAITDAMIEDVVRRVIERLAPDAVRAIVADVVSETAERLVKEEIDRIRNQHV
jgi:hypothetical protein